MPTFRDQIAAAVRDGQGVTLSAAETAELAACIRDWVRVTEAAIAFGRYDDLTVPVVCPTCGPADPRGVNAARRELHGAIQELWASIQG
jgi:hypothetical protein